MIVSLGSHQMPGTHMHDMRWTKCGSCLRVLMQVPTHQFPQIHWLFGDAKYDNGKNPELTTSWDLPMRLMGAGDSHEMDEMWWNEVPLPRLSHEMPGELSMRWHEMDEMMTGEFLPNTWVRALFCISQKWTWQNQGQKYRWVKVRTLFITCMTSLA